MTVNKTLEERGNNYGKFRTQAALAQELKEVMHNRASWSAMRPFQQEALEMIQHKVARLLNGNPSHIDGWHDISGYATLVERILNGEDI